jgi:hypothetical protein
MKNQKSFLLIILIVGLTLISCHREHVPLPSDEEILGNTVKPQTSDAYIYPIFPGTPQWANLASYDEMLQAVQIPDPVLKSISTWGLLESCFNYPLYGDFAAFNNQVGYFNVSSM